MVRSEKIYSVVKNSGLGCFELFSIIKITEED